MARAPGVGESLGDRARVSARGVRPRLPLVLVVDRSKSMRRHGRERDLNAATERWLEELRDEPTLRRAVDLAVVTFGGRGEVDTLALRGDGDGGFAALDEVAAVPSAPADGSTPLGPAIERAIELSAQHVAQLRGAKRDVYRPNIWIVTDGEPTDVLGHPTDDWHGAVTRLRAAERSGRLLVFAIGLRGADRDVLAEIAPESHYVDPQLSLANALRLVSISSRETITLAGRSSSQIYRHLREQLGVDEHGNLRRAEEDEEQ